MKIMTLIKLYIGLALSLGVINTIIVLTTGGDTRSMVMTWIAVSSMVIGFLFMYHRLRPIIGLKRLMADVKNGNMNVNINRAALKTDEIGEIMGDVYDLVDMNHQLVNDVDKLVYAFGRDGDIEHRINASVYKGSYKEMIERLNIFAENSVDDLLTMTNLIEMIGKGDFNLQLKEMPGKKNVINQRVNAFTQTMANISKDVDWIIEAASIKGDLDVHIDASQYEGEWRILCEDLNALAKAVDAPIVEIRDVMANLAAGKFDKKVSMNYNGDFKVISTAVNETIDTLAGYVNEISKTLAAMAGGDLTSTVQREYVGNFAEIKAAINKITETMRRAMGEISMAAKNVLEGATKITNDAQVLAEGSTAQAASLEELNTSVELINMQTKEFAKNANEANALSMKSTENAEKGNDAMKKMLDAMMQIKVSSSDISKIIRVIQDIAFQTNLLSLNAAVEAARAGEHGKGFGVVAEEVRNLAARSSNAASETTNLIQDSISRVESGAEVAQVTSNSLGVIVTNASDVLELINNISSAANEQAEMISQISNTLLYTATTVQNNSSFAHAAAATSEELNSQSEMLMHLVSFFKF